MKYFYVIFIFSLPFISFSQNLLNTSTWTVGSGSVSGFSQNGSTTENIREYGANHIGENVILWKAVPDAISSADGGWNGIGVAIDNTKKYRFSVWIKKTNSNFGTTYFGCQRGQSDTNIYPFSVLNLNNTVNTNPYFWYGDLPKLDRWYLLVGFVHGKNSTISTIEGAIYDGVTGEFVQSTHRDFKFHADTNILIHRAYLYWDTNTSDRQYFYNPRIEQVNSNTPSVSELLGLNPDSKLLFAYDNAGNQKQRFYCKFDGCTVETPPAGRASNAKIIVSNEEESIEQIDDVILLEKAISIYPNPTKGVMLLKLDFNSNITLSHSVNIFNSAGILVYEIPSNSKMQIELNISDFPTGVYLVHAHLSNGESVTKKIIKN